LNGYTAGHFEVRDEPEPSVDHVAVKLDAASDE